MCSTNSFPLPSSAAGSPECRRLSPIPMRLATFFCTLMLIGSSLPAQSASAQRARARDLGVKPGVFPPGALNAITDVAGVRVGQTTVVEGDGVRTGVTAILPHAGNLYAERVPAA